MTVVAIIVKTFTAFSYGKVIIIGPCCSYIKKVSSALAGSNTFAVNGFHFLFAILVFLFIIIVRHFGKFYS